jgi:hypothetical protein
LQPFGARIFGVLASDADHRWCRSSTFGEGAGLKNRVTACLAAALVKAGAETNPKPQKTAALFLSDRMATVFFKPLQPINNIAIFNANSAP